MKDGWNKQSRDAQNYRDRNKLKDWIKFYNDEIDAELEMPVVDSAWVKDRRDRVAYLASQVQKMKGVAPRDEIITEFYLKVAPPRRQPLASPSSQRDLVRFCVDQIEHFLAHLRDLLAAHLDTVDDDNVSDDDLTTTQKFNNRIRLLEVHRLKLLGRYGYDAYDHACRLKRHRHPALLFTPPTTAKDYSDVVASEVRDLLARLDHYDGSKV